MTLTMIVEPQSTGHRLYYVGLLLRQLQLSGKPAVVLTTRSTIDSAEWRVHLGDLAPDVIQHPADGFTLAKIAGVAAGRETTSTIIPNADNQLLPAIWRGWRGPGNLKLFVMRAESAQPGPPLSYIRPAKTRIKRLLTWAADRRPKVEVFALRSPLSPRRGPLQWVADPITLDWSPEQVDGLRKRLESHGDRYWIGVFGAICARKNLDLVIEAITEEPDIGLLLAGTVEAEVARDCAPLLERFVANGGTTVVLPGPLTASEFDSAIRAVDCVVVAQTIEGSSSTVLRGAAMGRQLILAGAESLRRDASKLGGQARWAPLNVVAIRSAVRQIRLLPPPAETLELDAEEFLRALT
jgi:hypothetical protein